MNLLNVARENFNKLIPGYINNPKFGFDVNWNGNTGGLVQILRDSKDEIEALQAVNRTYMYSIDYPEESLNLEKPKYLACEWMYNCLEKMGYLFDMETLEQSDLVDPTNLVKYDGKNLSPNFLRSLAEYMRIYTVTPNPSTILELGPGCGYTARVLLHYYPNVKYFILDIPQSLAFSYMFLSLSFPEKKVYYLSEPGQIKEALEADVILIPSIYCHLLDGMDFDLFLNTASLGEMTNEVIRNWMDFIQNKIQVKYLYTLNRFLNTIDERFTWRLNQNECSVTYDDKWNIINWEVEPYYVRCPYLDTCHARYLEIIASRPNNLTEDEKKQKSQQLHNDVCQEDWIRCGKSQVHCYLDNILCHDMTMTGGLFKTWEAIRLCKNKESIKLMLRYLDRLCQNKTHPFEESDFYLKQLVEI